MPRVVLRIDFDAERYIGHGRVELLEWIGKYGSIAQAAKAMGMSYKRAWYLADTINKTFAEPAIERKHGGKGGGSAKLTDLGRQIVRDYRDMEAKTLKICAKQLKSLENHLAPKRAKR